MLFVIGFILVAASLLDGGTVHTSAFLVRLCGGAAALSLLARSTRAIPYNLVSVALGCLAFLCAHTLVSSHPGAGLQSLATAFGATALFIAACGARRQEVERYGLLLATVALIHAVLVLWQWSQGADRPSGGFFNPNYFAALCVTVLLVGVHTLRSSQYKWIHYTALAVLGLSILATGSRSAIVALVVGLSIIGSSWLPRSTPFRIGALLLGTTIVALLSWRRFLADSDPYNYGRQYIWFDSAKAALKHPIGGGLGSYARLMAEQGVELPGIVRFARMAQHAHNEFIQAWVELGWAGLGLSIGLAAYAILIVAHSAPEKKRLHLAILVVLFIVASLSGALHVPIIALSAATWLGYVAGNAKTTTYPTFSPRWLRPLSLGVCIAAPVLVLPDLMAHLASRQAITARQELQPHEAQRFAEYAVMLSPWRVSHQLLRTSLEYLNGRSLPTTLKTLLHIAEDWPHDPRPLLRAAALVERRAQTSATPKAWLDDAVTIRCAAAARRPHNALMQFDCAIAHLHNGNTEKAVGVARSCLQIEPNLARAHQLLALVFTQRGLVDAASKHHDAMTQAIKHAENFDGYPHAILSLDPRLGTEFNGPQP